MTGLKCPRCGQQLEGDESKLKAPFCPRCENPEANRTAEPDYPTIIEAPGSAGKSGLSSQSATNHDTVAPSRAYGPLSVYPFLSPADSPDELGWLAHYRVMKLLGEGGMGMVFEAIDNQLQRKVALKVMKPEIAKEELARQRFLREARVTASVKSDHVVVIHQVGMHGDTPYLAMEFLHGEPLDKWLSGRGRPTLEEVLRFGMEISSGLASAHSIGLIHRDIKPGNIWLESKEETKRMKDEKDKTQSPSSLTVRPSSSRVKILDFGLARVSCDKANLTHTGLVLGTPAYMSPEQAEGIEVDSRCDLFSVGCVLYELATGVRPFTGPTVMATLLAVGTKDPTPPIQLNPDLPPALSDLILRLLAKKPQNRPDSAQEVADALQAIGNEAGVLNATPTTGIPRPMTTQMQARPDPAPPSRFSFAHGLAVAGSLLALGLAIWLVVALFRQKDDGDNKVEPVAALPELLLGMSGPLTGPSKELGREIELGIDTYVQHVNDNGGVHGRKLKFVSLDDAYEPNKALQNMKEFHLNHKAFAVIGNIGTPTALVTVPYAVENKILFFGAFTGAKILRKDPPDRYVFNYRASYEEETSKIVEYLIRIRKVKPDQIAVFDQNDSFGDAGFSGVVKELRKFNREPEDIVRVRYERNTKAVKDAADKILQKPDLKAVVMVGTYKPVTEFIRLIKDADRDLIFTNISFVGSEALAEGLRELGPKYADGVIVTQVVPPIDSGASVVLKYHERRKKYSPGEQASFGSLEGYITTNLFVEGLQRAGPNPTTEKVIEALETIRNFDMGTGAPLTFSPSEHQASHKVWATKLNAAGNHVVLDLTE